LVEIDIQGNVMGMLAIFKYAFRKIMLSRRVVIPALIALLIIAIMAYAGSEMSKDPGEDVLPEDHEQEKANLGLELMDALILFFFMPIIAMVYGASLIRDEIEDKSITQIATSPMRRELAYLSYYLALAASLSIVMLIIGSAGYLAYYGQVGFTGDSNSMFGSMAILMVIGSFVYSSLFIMLGVIFARPVFLGLFYAFIWEGFIGSMPGSMRLIAIKHYVRSLGADWISFGGISMYDSSPAGHSANVLIGLTLVFLTMGALLFRKKEFP
jgi:ABC-type transport system involved in multi-copper enzyme maturation permease subunit